MKNNKNKNEELRMKNNKIKNEELRTKNRFYPAHWMSNVHSSF